MKVISGLFRITRPDLSAAAGICVLIGQLLALGKLPELALVAVGFFSVFCIAGSILVVNDILDIETDKINAPHRPIPSGAVSKVQAIYYSAGLLIAGLFLSFAAGIPALITAIVLAIIGFIYNRYAKRWGLAGNLMVCFSVGTTFLFGGLTTGKPLKGIIIFFSVLAALFDLGEEIASDAMDAEGDKKINSRSLALVLGKKKALQISAAVFYLIIPLSAVPFLLSLLTPVYLLPLIYIDAVIIFFVTRVLRSPVEVQKKSLIALYRHASGGLLMFLGLRLIYG